MDALNLLERGGPIMYLILVMSILTVAIVALKAFHFMRLETRRRGFVDEAYARVQNDDTAGALEILARSRNPVARVMETSIRVGVDPTMLPPDSEAEIARVGSHQIQKMESFLRVLSSIAHLSPFCGLLGTVLGMIGAFISLESAGPHVDPAILSGGIWEALLTTAAGLAVAIPAMATYFYFEGEVDRIRTAMKDASVRVLVHFRKTRAGSLEPTLVESGKGGGEGGYGV